VQIAEFERVAAADVCNVRQQPGRHLRFHLGLVPPSIREVVCAGETTLVQNDLD
jgi:hypothetical protein